MLARLVAARQRSPLGRISAPRPAGGSHSSTSCEHFYTAMTPPASGDMCLKYVTPEL